jgi:hypothetical protein
VKATPELTKTILEDLDKLVAKNTRFVKMEILSEIKEELNKSVQSAIAPINDKLEKDLPVSKTLSISALVLSGVALLGMIWLAVK